MYLLPSCLSQPSNSHIWLYNDVIVILLDTIHVYTLPYHITERQSEVSLNCCHFHCLCTLSQHSALLSLESSCAWDVDGWVLWSVFFSLLLRGSSSLVRTPKLILGSALKLANGIWVVAHFKSSKSFNEWFVRRERLSTLTVPSIVNTRYSFPFDAGREKSSSARTKTFAPFSWVQGMKKSPPHK